MATEPVTELHQRVSSLRAEAFALIADVQHALRDGRAPGAELDLAATLSTLQAVANRLGRAQATLSPPPAAARAASG